MNEKSPTEFPPLPEALSCVLCGYKESPLAPEHVGTIQGNTRRFRDRWFRVWKCPSCGTILSVDSIDFADAYKDPLNRLPLDFFAKRTLDNLFRRLKGAGFRSTQSLLDYGCGNGRFLEHLKSLSVSNVSGYDPYVPDYSERPKGSYDCVVVNDVIEHSPNPRSTVHDAASFVKPGGILYIGTPDASPFFPQKLERFRTSLHQPFHRCLLTYDGLQRLGNETGFERVAVFRRTYLDTLFPFSNYRVFDELARAVGHDLDALLEPGYWKTFIARPWLFWWAFFGYFFPPVDEPAIVLRRPSET